MLEGLEISILNNHELERTLRIDSEFYSKGNLKLDRKLKSFDSNRLKASFSFQHLFSLTFRIGINSGYLSEVFGPFTFTYTGV